MNLVIAFLLISFFTGYAAGDRLNGKMRYILGGASILMCCLYFYFFRFW
jgi:Flp pilus assembly protein protease CpaA